MIHQSTTRPYLLEFGGALVLYAVTLAVVLGRAQAAPPGPVRTLTCVAPMLPVGLAIWAIVRQYRRSDEFIRRSTLEMIAIAAAVTAGWTLTYGFLENAGFPRLSMFTVWPVMGAVWFPLSIAHALRYR